MTGDRVDVYRQFVSDILSGSTKLFLVNSSSETAVLCTTMLVLSNARCTATVRAVNNGGCRQAMCEQDDEAIYGAIFELTG